LPKRGSNLKASPRDAIGLLVARLRGDEDAQRHTRATVDADELVDFLADIALGFYETSMQMHRLLVAMGVPADHATRRRLLCEECLEEKMKVGLQALSLAYYEKEAS
jgi:hypothetical protein